MSPQPHALGWEFVQTIWMFLSQTFEGASEAFEEFGIGSKQMVVLAIIEKQRTPGELRKALGAPASSITSIINELEKKGLIVREVHPTDRRQFNLVRTEKGEMTLQKGQEALEAHIGELFYHLEAEDIEAIQRVKQLIWKGLHLSPFAPPPGE